MSGSPRSPHARTTLSALLLALAAVLLASGAARAATSTRLVDPDSYTCPSSGFVDFEDFADGTDLSAESFPGIEFSTTNGFTWRVGDFAAGGYNGKYPSGIYTSKGTHWAWLGASQGSGRIDLTQGAASSFSLLVSANSGIYLEAYDDGGALLETAGPSAATTNSSQMAELRVTRATADIGYVIVHDSGNYFVVDGVCSDARGVGDKDTDGDGISDRWERDGADVDGDGRVDLDLPGMGADPLHKDLFVEVDWLTKDDNKIGPLSIGGGFDARPSTAAAVRVTNAFDAWPVPNTAPSGQGIHLHLDAGPDSIMNPATGEKWGSRSGANAIRNGLRVPDWKSWGQIDTFRDANVDRARRGVFHYVVYVDAIHCGDGRCTTGQSRAIPGHDLILAKGSSGVRGDLQEAVTLAHELGHNLGLGHGGRERADDPVSRDVNKKANYLSIMNYWYSNRGVMTASGTDGIMVFSPQELGTLYANDLDEVAGLTPDPFGHLGANYKCSNQGKSFDDAKTMLGDGWGSIDWDCGGSIADGSSNRYLQDPDDVACAYKVEGVCQQADADTVLGSEDYHHLKFWGVGQGWDARNVAAQSFDQPGTAEAPIQEAQADGVWWPIRSVLTPPNVDVTVYANTGSVPVPIARSNPGQAPVTAHAQLDGGGPGLGVDAAPFSLAPGAEGASAVDVATDALAPGTDRTAVVAYVADGGETLATNQLTLHVADGTPTPPRCAEARSARGAAGLPAEQAPALDAFLRVCDRPLTAASKPGLTASQALRQALAALCRGKKIKSIIKAGGCRVTFVAPSAGKAVLGSTVTRKARRAGAAKTKKTARTKTTTVMSGAHTFKRPGKAVIKVRLTKSGRKLLRSAHGKVSMRLAASFTDAKRHATRVTASRSVRR